MAVFLKLVQRAQYAWNVVKAAFVRAMQTQLCASHPQRHMNRRLQGLRLLLPVRHGYHARHQVESSSLALQAHPRQASAEARETAGKIIAIVGYESRKHYANAHSRDGTKRMSAVLVDELGLLMSQMGPDKGLSAAAHELRQYDVMSIEQRKNSIRLLCDLIQRVTPQTITSGPAAIQHLSRAATPQQPPARLHQAYIWPPQPSSSTSNHAMPTFPSSVDGHPRAAVLQRPNTAILPRQPADHKGKAESFQPLPVAESLARSFQVRPSMAELLAKHGPPKLLYFDFETTDAHVESNYVVQMAMCHDPSDDQLEHNVRIPPGQIVTRGAAEVHGISTEQATSLSNPTFGELWPLYEAYVEKHCKGRTPVLVAHNGKAFDNLILLRHCHAAGLSLPEHWLWLDSVLLARRLCNNTAEAFVPLDSEGRRSNRLVDLNAHFLQQEEQAHQASGDTKMLARVTPLLLQQMPSLIDPTEYAGGNLAKQLIAAETVKSHSWAGTWLAFANETRRRWQVTARKRLELPPLKSSDTAADKDAKGRAGPKFNAQVLLLAEAGKEEEALVRQLEEDPGLVARWQTVLEDQKNARGVLDVPLSWVTLRMDHLTKYKAARFKKTWDKLMQIKVYTVWELLQQYPREVIVYTSGNWREDAHILASGYVQNTSFRGSTWEADLILSSPPPQPVSEDGEWSVEDEVMDGTVHPNAIPPQLVKASVFCTRFAKPVFQSRFPVGAEVVVRGRLAVTRAGDWKMANNDIDIVSKRDYDPHFLLQGQEVVPVYSDRTPFKAAQFPDMIEEGLSHMRQVSEEEADIIPTDLRQKLDLMPWKQAVEEMHRPTSATQREAARRRLAFDELLLLQLILLLRRALSRSSDDSAGPAIEADHEGGTKLLNATRAALPFKLTGAQDRALTEVVDDMSKPLPMMRLLQGDVGCGKTAVAFLSMLMAVGNGKQAAIMAPTEILASQHYERLQGLLDNVPRSATPSKRRVSAAYLTSSIVGKARTSILRELEEGSIDILVGTHALISDGVTFKALGLAVVDEQHRFGVGQRAKLQKKANPAPHFLAMTATPIPRTLALVTAGDMALSIIDELPPGRSPIYTTRVSSKDPKKVAEMYEAIREELAGGGRAYIVCPLVEDSNVPGAKLMKAATSERDRLVDSGVLGDVEIGLVHGKMAAGDKQQALDEFSSGRVPVLVSTTVIEVGVDVVEASVMVVEHAERFGLAQLHQLRGRVGRGSRASSCYLVTDNPAALERLQVMEQSQDGFRIAEADLEYRGPGQVLGRLQSGKSSLGCLRAADLTKDSGLLELARKVAMEHLVRFGMNPDDWFKPLLAALRDRALPEIDVSGPPSKSMEDHGFRVE